MEGDPRPLQALSAFERALRTDDDLARALRDDVEGATVQWAAQPRGVERGRWGFVVLGLVLAGIGLATVASGVDDGAARPGDLLARGAVIFTGLFALASATACLLVPLAVRMRARRSWFVLFERSLIFFDPRPLRRPSVHHFAPPLISDVQAERVEPDGVGRIVLYSKRKDLDVPMVPHLPRVPDAEAAAARIRAALMPAS